MILLTSFFVTEPYMFPAEASVLLAFLLVALAVIVGLSVYVRRLLNKGIVCVCVF